MFFVEEEQSYPDEFLKLCDKIAIYPYQRGKKIKARRVLEFGKQYYWKDAYGGNIPEIVEGYGNSVLVNVYDVKSSYIGWHTDTIKNIGNNLVESYSFAKNDGDKNEILAVMEFKRKNGEKNTINLTHGMKVTWNLQEHADEEIQHRVSKTLVPRINITCRELK
mgnify:FL=1|tara:strand:+ start:275 stop:766 length:492 start_codon:yes stop_codon:yes gene_type:complete